MQYGERKRVHSNLLQQDIYLRENLPLSERDLKSNWKPGKFYSLDRISTSSGVEDILTENDYPISVESVNSFLDSTDYKKDLQSALSAPQRGVFADLTGIQDALKMSSSDFDDFKRYLEEKLVSREVKKEGNIKKSEVKKDNGTEL